MKKFNWARRLATSVYTYFISGKHPTHTPQSLGQKVATLDFKVEQIQSKIEKIQPSTAPLPGNNELTVVSLVMNGEGFIQGFVDHHFKIGAKHIVLLDNGSTDKTIQRALQLPGNITILKCDLPFGEYEVAYKLWMAQNYGHGCWCLIADIDERFDFPFSDKLLLSEFLEYLNYHKYSAVNLQMVDLFAEGPIHSWPEVENTEQESIWYDHTNRISRSLKGHGENRHSTDKIKAFFGGIRRSAFYVTRPLTKQTLIFPSSGPYLIAAHWAINGYFADVSCALLHYNFNKDFLNKNMALVARPSTGNISKEYQKYVSILEDVGNSFSLKKPTAKRLKNVNDLLEDGHLFISDAYKSYVKDLMRSKREEVTENQLFIK